MAFVSTSPIVKEIGPNVSPSSIDRLLIDEIVGASLTGLTVTVNSSTVLFVPSSTVSVIVAEPVPFAAGDTLKYRLAPLPPNTTFSEGTSAGFDELAETDNPPSPDSSSDTTKEVAAEVVSSSRTILSTGLIVGGSLVSLTVIWNVSVACPPWPSSTIKVIFATPQVFGAGVTTTVRSPPPAVLVEMLPLGISVWLSDWPITSSCSAGVSATASETVKPIADVGVSSSVTTSAIGVIVGMVLVSPTATTNVSMVVRPPSLTLSVMVASPTAESTGVI